MNFDEVMRRVRQGQVDAKGFENLVQVDTSGPVEAIEVRTFDPVEILQARQRRLNVTQWRSTEAEESSGTTVARQPLVVGNDYTTAANQPDSLYISARQQIVQHQADLLDSLHPADPKIQSYARTLAQEVQRYGSTEKSTIWPAVAASGVVEDRVIERAIQRVDQLSEFTSQVVGNLTTGDKPLSEGYGPAVSKLLWEERQELQTSVLSVLPNSIASKIGHELRVAYSTGVNPLFLGEAEASNNAIQAGPKALRTNDREPPDFGL